ncbi:MAG: hypothetical protein E6Q88_09100 [Lysobacteraceae bacterium]|nr:MAG: hypothetical protein E6Q88_09100 [Xanthomonadaceae bacterium]
MTATSQHAASGVIGRSDDVCPDFIALLRCARIVDEHRWSNEYSHVALRDRHGRLRLQDGRELRWMLRPGGLGYLESEQGERRFLVHCRH